MKFTWHFLKENKIITIDPYSLANVSHWSLKIAMLFFMFTFLTSIDPNFIGYSYVMNICSLCSAAKDKAEAKPSIYRMDIERANEGREPVKPPLFLIILGFFPGGICIVDAILLWFFRYSHQSSISVLLPIIFGALGVIFISIFAWFLVKRCRAWRNKWSTLIYLWK